MEQSFLELRTFVVRHPSVVWLACGLLLALASRLVAPAAVRRCAPLVFAAAAVGVVALLLASLIVPTYDDHVEPTVIATAAALANGRELYPTDPTVGVHSLPYGPVLYLALAGWGRFAGTNVASAKLAALAAIGIASVMFALACRRAGIRATWALSASAVTCGCFGAAMTWSRAEPMLLPVVALGILAVTFRSTTAAVLLGLAFGLAFGIKVTAPLFLAPLVPLLGGGPSRRGMAIAAGTATATAVVPFLHPEIALAGYIEILRIAGRQPFKLVSFVSELEWAALLLSPLLAILWAHDPQRRRGRRAALLVAVGCGLALAALASKVGAWPYYFLPFVPVVVFLTFLTREPASAPLVRVSSAIVAVLVISVLQGTYWGGYGMDRDAWRIEAEALQWRSRLGSSIAVGYGTHYNMSFARPVLGGSHASYPFDAVTLMEYQAAGRSFPASLIADIDTCRTKVWLIPRGDQPFALRNAYQLDRTVFPPEFVSAFERRYVQVARGTFFDAWECRP